MFSSWSHKILKISLFCDATMENIANLTESANNQHTFKVLWGYHVPGP